MGWAEWNGLDITGGVWKNCICQVVRNKWGRVEWVGQIGKSGTERDNRGRKGYDDRINDLDDDDDADSSN